MTNNQVLESVLAELAGVLDGEKKETQALQNCIKQGEARIIGHRHNIKVPALGVSNS